MVLRPIFRVDGTRVPIWSLIGLQTSIIVFGVSSWMGNDPINPILNGLFPPGFFALLLTGPSVPDFFHRPLFIRAFTGCVVLALGIWLLRIGVWSISLGAVVCLAVFLVVGERASKQKMCKAANSLNVQSFNRNSLLWSMGNSGSEFQFEIHALLLSEGQRFAWSYSEQRFFPMKETIWRNVSSGPIFECTD